MENPNQPIQPQPPMIEPSPLDYDPRMFMEMNTGIRAPDKLDSRWLFDYDYLWLSVEASFRGGRLKKDKDGFFKFVIPRDARPFMNDRGIKDTMALLKANVNIIGASTTYTEDRILMWCERMQKDLADMLYVHMDDYALDSSKYLIVISTLMSAYESNLRKSIGSKALMYSMQAEKVIESRTRDLTPPVSFKEQIFGGNR